MTEICTIESAEFERLAPHWSTISIKTKCGKELLITLEHQEYAKQASGQKAFGLIVDACGLVAVDDASQLVGASIAASAIDEARRILLMSEPTAGRVICEMTPSPTKQSIDPDGRYVYVISCIKDGYALCKIGIAKSPERRVNNLSTSSPHPLRLEFARYCDDAPGLERLAHCHFADRRRNGEWFAMEANEAIDFVVNSTRKDA